MLKIETISKMVPDKICRFCLSHKMIDDFFDINKEKLIDGTLSIRQALISCTKLDMNILNHYVLCCNNCLTKLRDICKFIEDCKTTSETLLNSLPFGSFSNDDNYLLKNEEILTESIDDTSVDVELFTSYEYNKERSLEEDFKEVMCRYCKKSFKNHTLLEIHKVNEHPVDRPHTCPICNKGFQSVSNRNTHIQSHNPAESFQCHKCQKSFRSKVYLNKHTKFVHSVAEKKCKICDKTFVNSAKYKYHARSHDISKQFHCKYCDRSFIQIHHLQNHERTHTGVCPFLCTVCGHRFKAACNLKLHMKTHTNDKKFVCNICSKCFKHQTSYNTHMKSHSSDLKEYQCECGNSFKQKQQLKEHIKAVHTQSKKAVVEDEKKDQEKSVDDSKTQKPALPYVCTFCDKRFKVPSSLLSHSRIHTEDRKYSCDKCNSKFKRREHLRIHVNGVHLKLKPFKCDICGRTFSQSGDRNIHMKSHSQEKEHSCTICEKKFRLVKALRTHLRIHTGEKPFCCTFCQQSFMTYMAIAAHTEKCQAELTAGKLMQTVSSTSSSEQHITMITVPNTSTEYEIQSIKMPTNIVPTTQS